jgi:hypothetical protein
LPEALRLEVVSFAFFGGALARCAYYSAVTRAAVLFPCAFLLACAEKVADAPEDTDGSVVNVAVQDERRSRPVPSDRLA